MEQAIVITLFMFGIATFSFFIGRIKGDKEGFSRGYEAAEKRYNK